MKRRADREGNTKGAQRLCRPTILYQRSMALAQSVGSAAAMLFACKDSEGEQDYKAHRFRAAYPLHLGYWSFLCLFFLVGLIEPSFQLVSVCLAPLFLLLIVVRVLAHRLDDHHLAQRFGSLMIAAGDSVIWVLAMLIFRSTEIKAGFLIVGLYICTIVVYPIILAMRAHSSVQVWGVLSVAAGTIIATPSWSALTQVEHVGLNMSAFALGIAIAYMIERLQRLLVQHERPQLAREREEAKGERPDSRERSQHDSPHAQEAVLRMRSSSLVLSSHLDYASYERVQELARGAHGTAVLWRCRNTGDELVSKEVSPDAEQESSLLSLQNEVRLLQNIRHEHIVAFVAALSLPGGHFCYLQEFARGGTLDAAIRARRTLATPFASTVVARWMRQLATAMAHLHELRVLHRDLSTKNILLSAPPCEGDIRVCDFGVAKALSLSHSNLASTIAGTPYYWSPEVLKGVPYGLAADIWSVGVVAFELLTLKRPFVAENLPALQLLVANGTANGTFTALDQALRACAHPYPLAWLASTEALLHTDPACRLPLASVIEVATAEEAEAVGAAAAPPSDAAIEAAESPGASDVCHATSDASTGSTVAATTVAAAPPRSPTLTPPQPALVQRRKKAVL